MIELENDRLVFRFPEVHPQATCTIDLQRTLRIPDDDRTYPLPPGLGNLPLRHIDDFSERVPEKWVKHGGVMLPMYQSEAMWIRLGATQYPVAVKVAAGKINAVTGEEWMEGLHRGPQDYVVMPTQPWLDGFCIEPGKIRQFVAMPLGAGYSAEEQLTGKAEHGGLQLVVYPMKAEAYERREAIKRAERERAERESRSKGTRGGPSIQTLSSSFDDEDDLLDSDDDLSSVLEGDFDEPTGAGRAIGADMGLAPGGSMKQDILEDPFDFDEWDLRHSSRVFLHLCNSMVWGEVTGEPPQTPPPTAAQYAQHGLPWFEHYSDGPAIDGGGILGGLDSVAQMAKKKGEPPPPGNASVKPKPIVKIHKVREGDF